MTSGRPGSAVLAEVRRSGFVEGVHRGSAVVLDPQGRVRASWGDPDRPIFPRSAVKPVQAVAMLRLGLDLDGPLLALAAASHSGESFHLLGVLQILADAGLGPDALQTPPEMPFDPQERDERVREGLPPDPLVMNCSGKHAAMLATCVRNGWDVGTYRHPDHPLQQAIAAEIARAAGESVAAVGVDGCGAPVLAVSLTGLARAFRSVAVGEPGTPERRVADAMLGYPQWAAGTRRDATALMVGVPGLLAKEGAEAVYAVALPDRTTVAVKVDDGGARARPVVMATLLRTLGVGAPVVDEQAELVLTGGGQPVGAVVGAPALSVLP
ncbi:MAG: asparaginase [Candidatus Nanopelagicales bacterium]